MLIVEVESLRRPARGGGCLPNGFWTLDADGGGAGKEFVELAFDDFEAGTS